MSGREWKIEKFTWAPKKSKAHKQAKKRANRVERREGKKDPESAPVKRYYKGYEY